MLGRLGTANQGSAASSPCSVTVCGNPWANLSFLEADIYNCWPEVTSILSGLDLADCLNFMKEYY